MNYMVYFVFFGCVLPPLVIMFLIYAYIYSVVRKQIRQIAAQTVATGVTSGGSAPVAAGTAVALRRTTETNANDKATAKTKESLGQPALLIF
jgi:hypothetical protein